MNKLNLKIIVPILNKMYDVMVPNNILVGNIVYMLKNALEELNNINIIGLNLYSSFSGEEIDLNEFVNNILKNGDTLIFV